MQTITISAIDFSAYASIAQADNYLLADPSFSAWSANDADTKGRFLVSATRLLDSQDWKPEYDTQTKRETVQAIIDASILIANSVSGGNTALLGGESTEPEVQELKAGSVSIKNFRDFRSASYTGSTRTNFPPAIAALLKPYLSGGSLGASAKSFGVSGDSAGDDDFGTNQP